MPSTVASGTQACTLDTEHSLHTTTVAGTYIFMASLTNSVAGDQFIIRLKTKVLTGDVAEGIYTGTYGNDLGANPIIASPPIVSMHSLEATIEQTDGTGRSVPWSLLRLDA